MNSKCKANIPHIHYVVLRRVRSLNGLNIVDFIKDKIAVSDSVKEELHRLRNSGLLKLCYTPLYNLGNNIFKFVFNNVISLHAHFQDIKAYPNVANADVIGIAETKLIQSVSDDDYLFPGFALPIRNNQSQNNNKIRPPHGIAVYVRNSLFVDHVSTFSTSNLEFVMADIFSVKGHVQVVFMYKASTCKLAEFKEELILNLLPVLSVTCSNIMIMGDFNFDLTAGQNSTFLEFMQDTFKCKQVISKFTTKYGSILNLVFTKVNPEVNVACDVLDAYWSDHKVIYAAADL